MVRAIIFSFAVAVVSTPAQGAWTTLAPGMTLGSFPTEERSPAGDSRITVLRIDPRLWTLELIGRSRTGESRGYTAKGWCEKHGLTGAINAGMFGTDYVTHVGYMQAGDHVNNSHVNEYQSVAAFDPREDKGLPDFRIFDLDDPGVTLQRILGSYTSVVQNLRLIKRPGENRWRNKERRWSEAALGEDEQGRVLFIFSRSPFSMHDLNRELLSLGIGLVAAQHLEGGPQAQLYLRVGDVEFEMLGRYETIILDDDGHAIPWPIPNVLGVRPKPLATNVWRTQSELTRRGSGSR